MAITINGSTGVTFPDSSVQTTAVSTPSGTVIYVAQNTAPTGYIKANGAAVSRTTYAALFSARGTTFGAGDGSTTFLVPDLRGEFLRGWDDARGIDSGRAFGSAQGYAIRNITGSVTGDRNTTRFKSPSGAFSTSNTLTADNGVGAGSASGTFTLDASTQVPTAAENRPRNIALLACIKF